MAVRTLRKQAQTAKPRATTVIKAGAVKNQFSSTTVVVPKQTIRNNKNATVNVAVKTPVIMSPPAQTLRGNTNPTVVQTNDTPISSPSFFSIAGQKQALSRVAGIYELIGRKIVGAPVNQPSNITLSEKVTNAVTSPIFVFGAPAVASAAITYSPALIAGARGLSSPVSKVVGGNASKSIIGNLLPTAVIAGIAGALIGGGQKSSTAPQNQSQSLPQQQNPVQNQQANPIQQPVQDQRAYNYSRNYAYITDSPGATIGGQGAVQQTPTQNTSALPDFGNLVPTQSGSQDQGASQSAGTGISPLLLIGGVVALAFLTRE